MSERKRVLFIAEAVTLAHVARPLALAAALDPAHYDITFACNQRYKSFIGELKCLFRDLYSVDSKQFLAALANGRPVYDVDTLRRYVRDDLALINDVKPELIVGDFRLSLSASARFVGIPYMAICNTYWSPYYAHASFPLPVLPLSRRLPLPLARLLFRLARPLAFALHSQPLNRVRHELGLPGLGYDLRRIYTDADHTLYADVPELFPTRDLPPNHHFLGPALWSPPQPKPEWWDNLPTGRAIVYVTLGSSGHPRLLSNILAALSVLPVTAIVATANAPIKQAPAANVCTAAYLPGIEAAQRASLVICNGGSPTSQQALAAGVPVLGICGNLDQFLNMEAIAVAAAGLLVRADRADTASIRTAAQRLLGEPGFKERARELAAILARYPAPRRFSELVGSLLYNARGARTISI
ncbi:MAG: glycosyltransferase [Thiobacillaceae bacterium]